MVSEKNVAEKIRKYANELLAIADELDGTVVKEQSIRLEDVRKVLAELSRNGKTSKVRELLIKYGANKLSEINPENYYALLDDARKLENGS